MKYRYLIAGISIINYIRYADGKEKKGRLGGCGIFAYAGIAAFTPDAILISSGGKDFWEYYGPYFKENDIHKEGIYLDLPQTHHTLLQYESDGRWSEQSIYGADYFVLQRENNRTSYAKLEPFLSEETRGLYLDSAGEEAIFEEIDLIRSKAPSIRYWRT